MDHSRIINLEVWAVGVKKLCSVNTMNQNMYHFNLFDTTASRYNTDKHDAKRMHVHMRVHTLEPAPQPPELRNTGTNNPLFSFLYDFIEAIERGKENYIYIYLYI